MPTTITASNSVDYHVWQLPTYSTPTPKDEIAWGVIDNDLGDGYRAGIRCGFSAGVRTWTLTLPTVPSLEVLSTTVTDINGASVSREQYIRSLFDENRGLHLRQLLRSEAAQEFEFIIIDSPPSLGVLTIVFLGQTLFFGQWLPRWPRSA